MLYYYTHELYGVLTTQSLASFRHPVFDSHCPPPVPALLLSVSMSAARVLVICCFVSLT